MLIFYTSPFSRKILLFMNSTKAYEVSGKSIFLDILITQNWKLLISFKWLQYLLKINGNWIKLFFMVRLIIFKRPTEKQLGWLLVYLRECIVLLRKWYYIFKKTLSLFQPSIEFLIWYTYKFRYVSSSAFSH